MGIYTELLNGIVLNATLLASGFIYLAPLKRRAHFLIRATIFTLLFGIGSVLSNLTYPSELDSDPIGFFLCYIFLVFLFFFCGNITFAAAMYCGILALISHQLTYGFMIFISKTEIITWLMGTGSKWLVGILTFGLFYSIFARTFARWMPDNGEYKIGPRQLSSALLLLITFETLVYIRSSIMNTNAYDPNLVLILISQFYCFTVLYLQSVLFRKSAMKHELDMMNRIWHQRKDQYNLTKENIAIINRKCHDLKHQVSALRTMARKDERERYLKEVENSVQIYDCMVETGNEVLNTVLTEKSLYCTANRININCVADGSQLAFIDPVDLYTIFGNAIDNAIESVQKFQNEQKRLIDVIVRTEKQFLVINIINPLERELTFEDGLPVSTKTKNGYHGFGMKSIRHIVKEYNGFLTINLKNNTFDLCILIPLPVQISEQPLIP